MKKIETKNSHATVPLRMSRRISFTNFVQLPFCLVRENIERNIIQNSGIIF
jgi:hypothetical protein